MALQPAAAGQPHNVVLFVPDGLRALIVSNETAPTMSADSRQGRQFQEPARAVPDLYDTNAAAMATGHFSGTPGISATRSIPGFPVPGAGGSLTPFLESDPVLGDVDEHFAGDYLDEVTLLKAAREAGSARCHDRKTRPGLIFDHTDRTGAPTIVIDESTGSPSGIPLSQESKRP